MPPWPNPRSIFESPTEDEYSRVTNAAKWRILGARADAWLAAFEQSGIAVVERHADIRWGSPPGTLISYAHRAVPRAAGALPLVVGRSQIEDVDDAGVTLGLGDPAVSIGWIPHCGCDACDSGSQEELDEVDQLILGVVSGTYRRHSGAPWF